MAIITPDEAKAALTTLIAPQLAELQTVIDVSVAACESYCRTILDPRETCETVDPESKRLVRLRNRPVSLVSRLAMNLNGALAVAYAGAASRATVALAGTSDPPYLSATTLNLTTVTNGVTATTPITLSTTPTLTDLKAAIEANAGWTATIGAGLDGFATADLIPDLAQRSAVGGGATLWAYTTDIQEWDLDPERGEIRFMASFFPSYRHPDRVWGGSPRTGRVWCRYTAGLTSPPDDLKRAVILTVKSIFDTEGITGLFQMETGTSGNTKYAYSFSGTPSVIPPTARAILDQKYRRISIG